eukprot:s1915_g6.t1
MVQMNLLNQQKSQATISRDFCVDPATRFVQLALPTLPGMSGSPVFDADGKVIAMVAKKFEEHGLAIPAERVRIVIQCLEATGRC